VLASLFPEKADEFRAMADEARRSRSIAAVAFPSDVAAGLALGRAVGGKAVERGKAHRLMTTGTARRGLLGYVRTDYDGSRPVFEPLADEIDQQGPKQRHVPRVWE
jgi:hypothetical protein